MTQPQSAVEAEAPSIAPSTITVAPPAAATGTSAEGAAHQQPQTPSPKRKRAAIIGICAGVAAVVAAIVVVLVLTLGPDNRYEGISVKDVRMISSSDASKVGEVSDGYIELSSDLGLQEGDLVSIGITPNTPYGLVCYIGAPDTDGSDDGGGNDTGDTPLPVKVPYKPATLSDVIEDADIEVKVSLQPGGGEQIEQINLANGVSLMASDEVASGSPSNSSSSDDASASASNSGSSNPTEGSSSTAVDSSPTGGEDSGDGDTRISDDNMTLDIILHIHDGEVESDITMEGDIAFDMELGDGLPAPASTALFSFDEPVTVNLDGFELVLDIDMMGKLDASGSISGSRGTIVGNLTESLSMAYMTGNGLEGDDISGSVAEEPSFEISTEKVAEDLTIKPTLSANVLFFGISGPTLTSTIDEVSQTNATVMKEGSAHWADGFLIPGTRSRAEGTLTQKATLTSKGTFTSNFPGYDNPFDSSGLDLTGTIFIDGSKVFFDDKASYEAPDPQEELDAELFKRIGNKKFTFDSEPGNSLIANMEFYSGGTGATWISNGLNPDMPKDTRQSFAWRAGEIQSDGSQIFYLIEDGTQRECRVNAAGTEIVYNGAVWRAS